MFLRATIAATRHDFMLSATGWLRLAWDGWRRPTPFTGRGPHGLRAALDCPVDSCSSPTVRGAVPTRQVSRSGPSCRRERACALHTAARCPGRTRRPRAARRSAVGATRRVGFKFAREGKFRQACCDHICIGLSTVPRLFQRSGAAAARGTKGVAPPRIRRGPILAGPRAAGRRRRGGQRAATGMPARRAAKGEA